MPKIWSPVILAQLDSPQSVAIDRVYQLNKSYQSIEDLRVKVQSCKANSHGKYVENIIRLSILALLQEPDHKPDLVRFEDELKEWLPLHCFDPPVQLKPETGMIVEPDKVICEGELQDRILRVKIHFNYTILAVQHEAVDLSETLPSELSADLEPYYPGQIILETIRNLEYEVQRLSQDNDRLNHRIMIYEKNLTGLKNALRKAENRSQALVNQLMQSNRMKQDLQEQLNKKEAAASLQNSWKTASKAENSRINLRDKIRHLFALGKSAAY